MKIFLKHLDKPAPLWLFCFLLLTLLGWRYLGLPPHWDVMGYVYPSAWEISLHLRTPLVLEYPDTGHPTLGLWLIALAWRMKTWLHLPGNMHFAAHLAILVFAALNLAYTYRLARVLLSRRESAIPVALLALSPVFFIISIQVHLDVILTTWALMMTYYFWKRRWVKFWLAGAAMSLTKAYGSAFLLIIPLYAYFNSFRLPYAARGRSVIHWAMFGLSPVLAFIAFMIYRKDVTGAFLTSQGHMSKMNLTPVSGLWAYLMRFEVIFNQMLVGHGADILMLAAVVGAGVALRRANGDKAFLGRFFGSKRGRFLLLLALPIPLSFLLWAFRPDSLHRYFMPVLPNIFILGSAGLVSMLGHRKKYLWGVTAALGLLLVFKWSPDLALQIPEPHIQRLLGFNLGEVSRRANVSDEVTLGFVDFINASKQAAEWLEKNRPGARILTAYPLNHVLGDPHCGYVTKGFKLEAYDYIKDVNPHLFDLYVYPCINVTSVNPDLLGQISDLKQLKRFECGRAYIDVYEMRPLRKEVLSLPENPVIPVPPQEGEGGLEELP